MTSKFSVWNEIHSTQHLYTCLLGACSQPRIDSVALSVRGGAVVTIDLAEWRSRGVWFETAQCEDLSERFADECGSMVTGIKGYGEWH